MSDSLPALSEGDIQQLSNAQSFERGYRYYRQSAVREPVCQGNELRGYCEGSGYEPYRVTATLSRQGIDSTACTCPYDWGGICKHQVALLLTWVHQPDKFHTVPPLEEMLADRSKEDLIWLIKEMIQREPDLARLLELPVRPDRSMPLDQEAFRRQIKYALNQFDFEDYYHSTRTVGRELAAIVDTAERFFEGGDDLNAGTIYSLVLEEVVAEYEMLHDENGDVAVELQRCAEGLENCFDRADPDEATRRQWLNSLLEAHIKDVELGGMDLAYPAGDVVIANATDEEWDWIEERVQAAIAALDERYSSWGREALIGFLAQRLKTTDQPEAVDDLIFEQGSARQRAFRLVEKGRISEAVEIAREEFGELPGLVDQFTTALVEAGAEEEAAGLMISLLNTRHSARYMEWLADYAKRNGDLAAALDWWRQSLRQTPKFETYTAIRELALELEQWPQTRQALVEELEAREAWRLLLDIALDEAEIDRALELLPKTKGWFSRDYEIKVARAAESQRPEAALVIYKRRSEALIEARGRDNYHTAAEWLSRVQHIYRQIDKPEEGQEYIRHLRQEYSNLPAFQDELNKAGLA